MRDIAAVAIQALTNNKDATHSEKECTVTGPESISYGAAAENLSAYLGMKISYVKISDDDAHRLIKRYGYE